MGTGPIIIKGEGVEDFFCQQFTFEVDHEKSDTKNIGGN